MLFRVTVPSLYPVRSGGFIDRMAREGHYVRAESHDRAIAIVRERLTRTRGASYARETYAAEFWAD